ncbi:MAG: LytR family transcriptional regulator [Ruminococcus sp.]|nr:LytR family transcriptional regulator [Ruminococcus sp.]
MSNKKSGRIAVPFLLTIFIGLILIGGAAIFIYSYFELGKEDELKEPIARSAATASYEDSHTILFIIDLPEENCSSTFVLMRSVPKEKKILYVGIPSNSIAVINDKQTGLKETYERGGADAAVEFAEQTLGVEVDKYMTFDREAFLKFCDIMGGVTYAINADIPGIQETNAEQYLSGSKILKVITYPFFSGGEEQRAYTASSIFSSMMNQADGKRLADNLDTSFTNLVNLTETDITAVDYKDKKTGTKYMLENGMTIARFRAITGTNASGSFIIDKAFGEEIKKEYFTVAEDKE